MSAVKLPRSLEERLSELAQQVRRLWLYRGLSYFAVIVLVTAFLAILIDAEFELPGMTRTGIFFGWLGITAIAAWRYIWRPSRSPIPVPLLASAIEQHFPSLSERLSTLVELSENLEPGNGSRALVDVLAKETAQRTKRLNFFKAAPTASVIQVGLLAMAIAALVMSPLFLVQGSGERLRRFLLPWYTPVYEVPYRVVVSSGSPIIKRGESVTLTAVLERLKPEAELPESAVLVYREGNLPERKLPMTGDQKGAFHVTRPEVQENFEYHIEAGPARSETNNVTVVDPVELAEGSTFTIQSPAYAQQVRPTQVNPGLSEFEAVQFSKILFHFKFSRPARTAYIDWKSANPNAVVDSERMTCKLTPDHLEGTVEWMLIADGTLKLVLVGDRDIKTEISVASKAIVDTPPRFEKVVNINDRPREIRPDDRIPIDLTIGDDFGVSKVQIEYQVNDEEKIHKIEVPLKGLGSQRAEGRYQFSIADKARDRDTLKFRVRAVDNRQVPEFQKQPQEVLFPEKSWSTLTLNPQAKPLLEQEVVGQREKFKEKLGELIGKVADARREADSLEKEAAGKPELDRGNIAQLEKARTQSRAIAQELDELAREAGLTPALRPLAEGMKAAAEETLRKADETLRRAANELEADSRDRMLKQASQSLAEATDRLKKLLALNQRLAQDRFDQDKLERLAAEERKLADEAKKIGDDAKKAAEIAKKQQELEKAVEALKKENETIRDAVEKQNEEEAARLAAEARRIADIEKELEEANKNLDNGARKRAIDEAAKKQKEIDQKAAEIKKKTDPQADLAGVEPLNPQAVQDSTDKLNHGDALGAMTEQEKAARELERLANDLAQKAAARKDPKEAANQLAKLEDALRKQHDIATKQKPFDQLADDLQKQMKSNQQAVKKAIENLNVPENNAEAKKAKEDALKKLQAAEDALKLGREQADKAMAEATEAIRKLAEKLPSREQRLQVAQKELEKLQREQDAVRQDVHDKTKGLDRKIPDEATRQEAKEKLAEAAKKQAEIADKLQKLDSPGLDQRKQRAVDAAKQAAEDLKEGRTQDLAGSQEEAKRNEDRLAQAMNGNTPADEKVDEIARKQREIADHAKKSQSKMDENMLQQLQQQEKEIDRQLAGVKEADSAEKVARARDSIRETQEAIRRGDPVEVANKTEAAAQALDRLANDLAGVETPAQRAERLAKELRETAEKSQKNVNKPADPLESAKARADLERESDELKGLRAGEAQQAKKKAADALDRLRKTPNPDKAPGLQKAAADAMKDLADQLKGPDDQTAKRERGDPDANSPPDDAGGQLPSKKDAEAAKHLAEKQREARDQLAKDNEKAGKGTRPTDNKEIQQLAKEQEALAKEAEQLAKDSKGNPGEQSSEKASSAAKETANDIKNGAMEKAQAAGEKSQKSLESTASEAGASPRGQQANRLAKQQAELNKKIAEAGKDPGAAAAQQAQRQQDLAKEADQLAKKLDEKAKGGDEKSPEQAGMKKAAEAAREAGQQMDRAGREQAAGRPGSAQEARTKAREAMEKAAKESAKAGGEKPTRVGEEGPADPSAADAGQKLDQAQNAMKQAGKELGKSDGPAAGQAMKKAADQLDQAAEKLAQAGQPGQGKADGQEGKGDGKEGPESQANSKQPGQGSKGPDPGGNDGSGNKPATTDIPTDLQKYAGKPWGELPGDIKARILQDVQAKYGEDYARVIKLYFEQLADKK